MQIFTETCSNCGTIVSANELESRRVFECPRLGCENVLRFEDLPERDREFFLANRDQYRL